MATKRNTVPRKQCRCHNTNCLKLYCGCFAAESYCSEVCSCKECFNRLGYEDKVNEAHEEALERNPYAFSTKEGQDHRLMPTLEKHKKGCTCRVRMCIQESCKCFKAQVGCGGHCLCVGCENVHGKRGDYNFDHKKIDSDEVSLDQLESSN